MPKFYRKNKKRIDPRYFLNESVEREELIDDIRELSKEIAGYRNTYGDIDELVELEMEELEEILQMLASKSGYDNPVDDREPLPPEEFTSRMLDTRDIKS
jgi:septation ring formation regulator EzrA